MNSFELVLNSVKTECEKEVIRIQKNAIGLRRDINRRINNITAEYIEKVNVIEAKRLDLKRKLNAISDMKGRIGLMDLLAENERERAYLKSRKDVRIREEKGELSVRMDELNIRMRTLRNERDAKIAEIMERYLEWLPNSITAKKYVNRKQEGNETV